MERQAKLYLGAMELLVAFKYTHGDGWKLSVCSVTDNDGDLDWDQDAFESMVLSKFSCFEENISTEGLIDRANLLLEENEPSLVATLCPC